MFYQHVEAMCETMKSVALLHFIHQIPKEKCISHRMEKDTIMIGAEPFKVILSKQQPWKKQKEKGGHLVMYATDIKIYV